MCVLAHPNPRCCTLHCFGGLQYHTVKAAYVSQICHRSNGLLLFSTVQKLVVISLPGRASFEHTAALCLLFDVPLLQRNRVVSDGIRYPLEVSEACCSCACLSGWLPVCLAACKVNALLGGGESTRPW